MNEFRYEVKCKSKKIGSQDSLVIYFMDKLAKNGMDHYHFSIVWLEGKTLNIVEDGINLLLQKIVDDEKVNGINKDALNDKETLAIQSG